MVPYNNWKTLAGIGTLLGLGWTLVAFNTVRAIRSDASTFSRLMGVAIPFALAIVLFVGAFGIVTYGLLEYSFLVAGWAVLGTIAVTAAIVLNIIALENVRPEFLLTFYMIINGAGGGAAFGLLVGLYDAHQQRLQEEWKVESNRAKSLSQRLSVINRVLRHDIRNQAQIISGFTQNFEAGTLPEEFESEQVQRASDRLVSLADEAREIQYLLDGEDLEPELCDVVTIVRDAAGEIQKSHSELSVHFELPDKQLVMASPFLEHAIKHLFSNTIEHNDSDHPEATVRLDVDESKHLPVRLTIEDNGPGIPQTEPLPDPDLEETQLEHSQGLGLWVVNWVIEESQGQVEFETDAGGEGGTRVTLKLSTPTE